MARDYDMYVIVDGKEVKLKMCVAAQHLGSAASGLALWAQSQKHNDFEIKVVGNK